MVSLSPGLGKVEAFPARSNCYGYEFIIVMKSVIDPKSGIVDQAFNIIGVGLTLVTPILSTPRDFVLVAFNQYQ